MRLRTGRYPLRKVLTRDAVRHPNTRSSYRWHLLLECGHSVFAPISQNRQRKRCRFCPPTP